MARVVRLPAITPPPRCLPLLVYLTWAILLVSPSSAHNISSVTAAVLSYSYTDSASGDMAYDEAHGAYGHGSLVRNTSGVVTHVRHVDLSSHDGCTRYVNTPLTPHSQPWVALVQRGQCTFQQKIDMANLHNATAIVIYNKQAPKNGGVPEIEVMNHAPTLLTAVLIDFVDGEKLVELVDSGVSVYMDIAVGNTITPNPEPAPTKKHTTAVLLAFVGFLILGLIVVVVYAVRHAKYVHSRNQNNLSISLRQADGRQGQESLLNNLSTHPGHPAPLRTDGPSLIHQPLQVQALLPQIQEEDEQQQQPQHQQQNHQQQQQNHQQLDLGDQSLDQTQHSPLLPH